MKAELVITYCIFIFIFFLSCAEKREVRVLGFAYKGERITVMHEQDTIVSFKAEDNADSISICSFYKTADLKFNKEILNVKVVVDSNKVNVLDTTISITKLKEPFISLLYPHDLKGNERNVFVDDEADSTFLKCGALYD
ncbi:hypothetical protein [Niastella populi]|uniref:DUF4369 domain-containing protein n=1 Tax=Niastella populi TaxID=550983 RepID=A0A1V9G6F9_9BACT|nr:hypothetical protein [Niastella populi]OQP66225.1 hypothetical protein A4R26_14150 [Niastella populi]